MGVCSLQCHVQTDMARSSEGDGHLMLLAMDYTTVSPGPTGPPSIGHWPLCYERHSEPRAGPHQSTVPRRSFSRASSLTWFVW